MQYGQELPPPPEPQPAIRYSRPVTTGDTVTVACKLPHGLLLRIFVEHYYDDPQQDGSLKRVKSYRPVTDQQFVLKGTWAAIAGQAYNRTNSAVAELLPGGYALTYGVRKDLWDQWYEQNKTSKLVKQRVVFASPSLQAATAEARENRSVKSGMEPVDPDNPAQRMPGGMDRRLRMSILNADEPGTSQR